MNDKVKNEKWAKKWYFEHKRGFFEVFIKSWCDDYLYFGFFDSYQRMYELDKTTVIHTSFHDATNRLTADTPQELFDKMQHDYKQEKHDLDLRQREIIKQETKMVLSIRKFRDDWDVSGWDA